jgi:hypothetical protein
LFLGQRNPEEKHRTRGPSDDRSAVLVTKPCLRAFDKQTGRLIAEVDLPDYPTGAAMTYYAGGRQYIVVAVGGGSNQAELVALSLPPQSTQNAGSSPTRF